MTRPCAFLAAVGDVNDPITWSGTPYYFLQSARVKGLLQEGLPLSAEGVEWQRRRVLWNGWRYLTGRGKGGYQYSVPFLEKLWRPVQRKLADQIVVNCFQLYAPSIIENQRIQKVFYIDMTLLQLFDFYQQRATVGHAIAHEAVRREKEGYQSAKLVVCHSRWTAESIIRDYGIGSDKVKVVVPGANLDRDAYLAWDKEAQKRDRKTLNRNHPLKLVFVGKYWQRKGLDRLLEALQLVQKRGFVVDLTVIGCQKTDLPERLQETPKVAWYGFVDKRRQFNEFLNMIASSDIGCLLSRAEAGGMALREFHALGLVVMGPDVGGAFDHLFPDIDRSFKPNDPAELIADWLIEVRADDQRWEELRRCAWQRRHRALWDYSVEQWQAFWPPAM
jgi:glycosyltransferase involved in cell wall biosynthesis